MESFFFFDVFVYGKLVDESWFLQGRVRKQEGVNVESESSDGAISLLHSHGWKTL